MASLISQHKYSSNRDVAQISSNSLPPCREPNREQAACHNVPIKASISSKVGVAFAVKSTSNIVGTNLDGSL